MIHSTCVNGSLCMNNFISLCTLFCLSLNVIKLVLSYVYEKAHQPETNAKSDSTNETEAVARSQTHTTACKRGIRDPYMLVLRCKQGTTFDSAFSVYQMLAINARTAKCESPIT